MAICDDEPVILEKAEQFVQVFNATHKEEYTFITEKYLSPVSLRDDILEGRLFDVFLLDMEMPEMSGVSLGIEIRDKLPDSIILFLSAHTEFQFTQEGYKVEALRYISKLVMETALTEALEATIKAYQKGKNSYYIYSHYSESARIPLDEILYVHRVKRMVVIVTRKMGEFQMKRPLKDVFTEINDSRFAFADQSCFVNLNQVVRLAENEVTLKDNTKIPVSRKMMPGIKSTLLRVWGEIK